MVDSGQSKDKVTYLQIWKGSEGYLRQNIKRY